MKGTRLDDAVAEQFALSRSHARSLILEGRVRVDGEPASKAGANVRPGAAIEVRQPRRYVSRGGEKLEAALDAFALNVENLRALDIGASTGGFTDCLLQRGAAHVTALDVGYGQLDWRLRNDPRVTVMERTHARNLSADAFAIPFDLIVIDVSFISLHTILASAIRFLAPDGTVVALVKPQFEAGKERLGRGGVVRDPAVHRAILHEVVGSATALGLFPTALISSPLKGPAGNREFLLELRRAGESLAEGRIDEVVGEGLPVP